MKRNIISLKNIVKEYKMGEVIVRAVENATFDIIEGEFTVILGPSGSGKSTLLNIIGGMDRPTSGEVLVDGIDITNYTARQLTDYRKEKIGFVFQFYNLISNLTAKENVELSSRLGGNSLDIDEVLESVGLCGKADSFPSRMSGGEQQRVSIARAVVKDPLILLGDEPTGALDYTTGKSVLKLLYDINKTRNKTVIIITHNAAISEMADKVIKMRSGMLESITVNENPVGPERIEW